MSTICAISTPYGVGGIAVIRVSGENAIAVVDGLFRGKQSLLKTKTHTLHFGTFLSKSNEVIDEVVVSIFRTPHSFTGEDVVEISCHGSLYVQQTILQTLIEAGAQMAAPGEFTQRAFLNGRLDLTQAEAIADLISSQNKAEHDLALHQLRGGIYSELKNLRERLLKLTSLLELELDFADHEELEFADRTELRAIAQEIQAKIGDMVASFRTGNAIKNGVPVAIVGPTNAGKSTLLNCLAGEERAIVSEMDGTTRDWVEARVNISGIPFRFIDTAGLRTTTDAVENIGIARSRLAAQEAQIILLVVDGTRVSLDELEKLKAELPLGRDVIVVFNKSDKGTFAVPADALLLSAKEGDVEVLKERLVSAAALPVQTYTAISNMRHYEALSIAFKAIERVLAGMDDGLSGELISMDLRDCLNALGQITGEISSDDVLHNIFSKFCIGK